MAATATASPFSFSELLAGTRGEEQAKQNHQPVKLKATDGVELSVTIYKAKSNSSSTSSQKVLVFYHGGGAHSGAGYNSLAQKLSEQYGITVYLPDIRGHGASGGPRGDAPSKEQVWNDIDTVLEYVVATEQGSPKIFLGGHSSGGGLVVNYATSSSSSLSPTTIEGYILVAPELGYNSKTARPGRTDFAKVNILAFIANGIFGILGHSKAVKFQYPAEILEDEGMVSFNTVNMANAITPETPNEQVAAMGGSGGEEQQEQPKTPIGIWVGADDELFVAEKVIEFVPDTDQNERVVLPEKNHLGILVDVHENIGRWITNL